MFGWNIIPVGANTECMVWNPVGVSGSTGRVDWGERCEVVAYQLKSGLEVRGQQNQNARMAPSEGWKLFEKNIPKAASMFLSTKGYAGDSGGTVVTYIVHMCTHVCTCKGFPAKFLQTVRYFCSWFLHTVRKKKGCRKLEVWRSYGMQYLHTYSFNIKGFFWYHVRKLTNIQCTDVGNGFPVWLVFHLFLTKMSSKVEQQCIIEWTLQTLLQPKKKRSSLDGPSCSGGFSFKKHEKSSVGLP